MRTLYPAIEPYAGFSLRVEPECALYVEQCGNPDGVPMLFLHGGPGAGCAPWHRRFFSPDLCRAILFDQRGCGRSKPRINLRNNTMCENNTTELLVADIERLREHLAIEQWGIFGGSWGSTLALAYAETHPDRCLGLILRGIFLCRDIDLSWFYHDGASRLMPEHWQNFIAPVNIARRDNLIAAYHEIFSQGDKKTRLDAALAWSRWEANLLTLIPDTGTISSMTSPDAALDLAQTECHYFYNNTFMRPNQLLKDTGRLKNIPGVIVHGRYDIVCPVDQAVTLHEAWPDSELHIVDNAGHAASEPGILHHLVEATDKIARHHTR